MVKVLSLFDPSINPNLVAARAFLFFVLRHLTLFMFGIWTHHFSIEVSENLKENGVKNTENKSRGSAKMLEIKIFSFPERNQVT